MSEPEMKFGDVDMLGNSYTFTVSREYALDFGLIEPTPEELAERNARSHRFHIEQRATRAEFLAAIAQLREAGGLATAILGLHAPDTEGQWASPCPGCDYSGYEGEPPEWPCRTVRLVAEHHGVDLPDCDLPGAHYEREFVPRR